MVAVVLDELDEQRPELAFVSDQGAVERFVAHGTEPAFRERGRFACPGGVVMAVIPATVNTVSNGPEYWLAPSRRLPMRTGKCSSVLEWAGIPGGWTMFSR